LKLRQQPVLTADDVEETVRQIMMNKKLKKHPAIVAVDSLAPPRSAPSMIPQRVKTKKQVRVSSESAIIMKDKCAGDPGILVTRVDSRSLADSMAETNFTSNCSNFISDLEISVSKNLLCEGSKTKMNQRTVGTNYSVNDFEAPSDATTSVKRKKPRRCWCKLFCC